MSGSLYFEDRVFTMRSTHILFVCTGNTCRSPMAQGIAESLISKLVLDDHTISVDSAGVSAGDGYQASQEAVEAMSSRDIDLSVHQSKQLTPDLIDQAQAIYTMTPSHTRAVVQIAPG